MAMSGMTGYDQATSYPSAAQYNSYVPNLPVVPPGGAGSDPTGGVGGDPRAAAHMHQWHQYQHHHHPHPQQQVSQMEGSPTHQQQQQQHQQQRYPYYDRNGYYMHQGNSQSALDPSAQNWHEPVSVAGGTGAGINVGSLSPNSAAALRPDSPNSVQLQQQQQQHQLSQHSFPGNVQIPPPPPTVSSAPNSCGSTGASAVGAAAAAGSLPPSASSVVNQYSCKMPPGLNGPPSPSNNLGQPQQQPQQPQKTEQPSPHQYQAQYQCPITQQQQQQQQSQQQVYNNNLPPGGPHQQGGPGPVGGHNTYALTPEHGQPSPTGMGSGNNTQEGPTGGGGAGGPQAPISSVMYPWMRSQFGESIE